MLIAIARSENPPDHTFRRPPNFPYWTLGYAVEGSVRIEVDNARMTADAPYLTLTPPEVVYAIRFGGRGARWISYYAIFTPLPHWLPWLDWPQPLPGKGIIPLTDDAVRRQIHQCWEDAVAVAARHRTPEGAAMALNSLERVLLLAHLQRQSDAVRPDPRVTEVQRFLSTRLNVPLSLDDLADAAGMSVSHLTHLFHRQTGEPPMRYLERLRVEHACHLLLNTNLAIAEIAERVGYANPFHFSTRFRAHTGVNPRAYRQHPTTHGE